MHTMKSPRLAVALAALFGAAGCHHVGTVAGDAGEDGGTDPAPDLAGVDLLVMIDDSSSMAQEQAILATDLFAFVGSLVSPLPTSAIAAIDDLRIAVVTSNMGFSSSGETNDAHWPYDVPLSCTGFGDDGEFQTIDVSTIHVDNDTIPCDESAAQCPPSWTCASLDEDGVGACHTAGDATIGCPALAAQWIESTPGDPDPNLAARAACLSAQGTMGCGFEQQLASSTRALERDDQSDFARDEALLAVLVVSDEEDCSMADGEALFGEDEVLVDAMKVNIACGEHPEHLFPPADFHGRLTSLKQPGAVLFAAIVGVPYGDQGGAPHCQGFGDTLGSCLEQEEMQLLAEQSDGPYWYYHPACTRDEGSTEVTKAYPGRRYVELASVHFGDMGYVYSICNADWAPAFEAIGARMAALAQ